MWHVAPAHLSCVAEILAVSRLLPLMMLLLLPAVARAEAPPLAGCPGVQVRTGAAMGSKVVVRVCPKALGGDAEKAALAAAEQGFAEVGRLFQKQFY